MPTPALASLAAALALALAAELALYLRARAAALAAAAAAAPPARGAAPPLLLVTAHPDDESMFFAPLLDAARAAGMHVRVLSLTDGGAGGDGRVRARELAAAGAALGFSPSVAAVAGVRDGMHEEWDVGAAARAIVAEARAARARARGGALALASFDARGVTGHANHVAAAAAARAAARALGAPLFALRTVPRGARFCGPRAARARWAAAAARGAPAALPRAGAWPRAPLVLFARGAAPCAGVWRGMRAHASQFVWHRRLWAIFSAYAYFVELECVDVGAGE